MKLVVIVVQDVPEHTHGVLSRWTIKVAPTVCIGTVSSRVRDLLWSEVTSILGQGRATLQTTNKDSRSARPAQTDTSR